MCPIGKKSRKLKILIIPLTFKVIIFPGTHVVHKYRDEHMKKIMYFMPFFLSDITYPYVLGSLLNKLSIF